METPHKHPLTLRFRSNRLEAAFYSDYVQKSLKQIRYALLLGIVIYGLIFGVLDVLNAPAHVPSTWAIRAGVCLLGLGAFIFTFSDAFKRVMQPAMSLVFLVAGLGLLAMLALDTSGEHFYDGPVLVILPTYVLLRLRFVYATLVGWLIVVAFVGVAVWIKETPQGELISSIIFFSSANIIGMFAGYMLEDYARQVFWQTQVIDEKRKQNERLLQIRSRFFANVSHEFRTPLTLILGPLDNLLDRTASHSLPEALQEQLDVMRQNARRLLRLINQLLDVAKLEAGNLHLSARHTPVVPFVKGIVHAFSSYAERKHIDLQFFSSLEDDALALYIDRDKFDKVIVNLLSNAIKFTPEGGTVRVALSQEASSPGGTFTLRVRDTGPGIPAQDLPSIFNRFASIARPDDSQHLHEQGGTGIGLALTKELVDLHQGTITVQSEPGFGSEFIVALPLGRRHLRDDQIVETAPEVAGDLVLDEARIPALPLTRMQEPVPPVEETPAFDDEDAETLLIVDDNADMRGYIKDCLGDAYTILEAADGQAGLDQAHATVPDLIITDVMMPGMDGYTFSRAMKTDRVLNHIPVIMLTAKASAESKIEGLEIGVDDYLYKPFNARELNARVRNLLDTRRLLRQRFSREVLIQPTPIEVQSADDAFIEQARAAVEAHIDDEHFDVDAFAEAMHMSRRQLQRKLRAVADQTPNSFTRMIRLGRAAQLLDQQYGTVSDVAYAVGFSNPSYFAKCFREIFGVAPSDYSSTVSEGE